MLSLKLLSQYKASAGKFLLEKIKLLLKQVLETKVSAFKKAKQQLSFPGSRKLKGYHNIKTLVMVSEK